MWQQDDDCFGFLGGGEVRGGTLTSEFAMLVWADTTNSTEFPYNLWLYQKYFPVERIAWGLYPTHRCEGSNLHSSCTCQPCCWKAEVMNSKCASRARFHICSRSWNNSENGAFGPSHAGEINLQRRCLIAYTQKKKSHLLIHQGLVIDKNTQCRF